MQTAKTILMLDGSNNFISPATNIESLYYEKAGTDQNLNIIYRHLLSLHFPVYVNTGEDTSTTNYKVVSSSTDILDISTKESRIIDTYGNDVILSNFAQRRIAGTNYYAIDVSSYNLSELLQSYAGLSYTEKLILNLSTFILVLYDATIRSIDCDLSTMRGNINNISTFISNLDTSIYNLQQSITYMDEYTYDELENLRSNNALIPGCNYILIYDPNLDNSNKFYSNTFNMVLLAVNANTFDIDVIGCLENNGTTYFNSQRLDLWEVKYDFGKNIITYMKDEYGNEANFDFKNKKMLNDAYLFNTITNKDYSLIGACLNNKIMSNDNVVFSLGSNDVTISNNYIGYDCSDIDINIKCDFNNNTIGNNNAIITILNTNSKTENNNIGNDNKSITISGSNNTINSGCNAITIDGLYNEVETSCKSISIYGTSNIVELKCTNINIGSTSGNGANNIVLLNCLNVDITSSTNNVTVAQYIKNTSISTSNVFYTYQTIYSRGYKSI